MAQSGATYHSLIGLKGRTGLLDFYISRRDIYVYGATHKRHAFENIRVRTHTYIFVYSTAICVVSGRALCDLLCINLRCVYITRGLQDNDRSMRHARINGPHGYMAYCTHWRPLSVCLLVFSHLPLLFLLSRNV